MTSYHDLPHKEKEQLLMFPAYISLLAANYHNNGIDKKEKQTAIEYAHIKTFSSNPILMEFFTDAEKDFEKNITFLNEQLPKRKGEREIVIREALSRLEKILSDLGTEYSFAMHESMNEYKEHVAHAHQSLMEYLVFPIPIKGLTY
ncbi:hypothetical protein BH11BAC1_BH11BAC1_16290 [soil metagenome]